MVRAAALFAAVRHRLSLLLGSPPDRGDRDLITHCIPSSPSSPSASMRAGQWSSIARWVAAALIVLALLTPLACGKLVSVSCLPGSDCDHDTMGAASAASAAVDVVWGSHGDAGSDAAAAASSAVVETLLRLGIDVCHAPTGNASHACAPGAVVIVVTRRGGLDTGTYARASVAHAQGQRLFVVVVEDPGNPGLPGDDLAWLDALVAVGDPSSASSSRAAAVYEGVDALGESTRTLMQWAMAADYMMQHEEEQEEVLVDDDEAALGEVGPCERFIKAYLSLVYPTARAHVRDHLTFNASRLFYRRALNTWYRAPVSPECRSGLLHESVERHPGACVDFAPDTGLRASGREMREHDDCPDCWVATVDGFVDDTPRFGSNRNWIEVSAHGWFSAPFGRTYAWSAGSGVWLSTEGSTLAAFNKVHALHRILYAQGRDKGFRNRIGSVPVVMQQLTGLTEAERDDPLTLREGGLTWTTWEQACDPDLPGVTSVVEDHVAAHGWLPLLFALRTDPGHWRVHEANLCLVETPREAYAYLVGLYIDDHLRGVYNLEDPRFSYMQEEARSPDFDLWLLRAARRVPRPLTKEQNFSGTAFAMPSVDGVEPPYAVIQLTRAPSCDAATAFLLLDTRWPEASHDLGHATADRPWRPENALIHAMALERGRHFYDVAYAWTLALERRWLWRRDPWHLSDEARAEPLLPTQFVPPPYDTRTHACDASCRPLHLLGFDAQWLPDGRWNDDKCQERGCHPSDRLAGWAASWQRCTPPVRREGDVDNLCRTISWSLTGGDAALSPLHPQENANAVARTHAEWHKNADDDSGSVPKSAPE